MTKNTKPLDGWSDGAAKCLIEMRNKLRWSHKHTHTPHLSVSMQPAQSMCRRNCIPSPRCAGRLCRPQLELVKFVGSSARDVFPPCADSPCSTQKSSKLWGWRNARDVRLGPGLVYSHNLLFLFVEKPKVRGRSCWKTWIKSAAQVRIGAVENPGGPKFPVVLLQWT
jgi:hypothetical protein